MSSAILTVIALLTISSTSRASDVDSCQLQRPCLTYFESGCNMGIRMVCLGSDPSLSGCTLGTDTINDMCSLFSGSTINHIQNSVGQTCAHFAGGTKARFAVSDENFAIGSVAGGFVAVRNGAVEKTRADCNTFPGSPAQLCTSSSSTVRSSLWTFTVSTCPTDCFCYNWAEWSSCSSSCNRARACLSPGGCNRIDQEHCDVSASGGQCVCTCTRNLWTEWTACLGGIRRRTRPCNAVGHGGFCADERQEESCTTCICTNDIWSAWSTCGADSMQTRSRRCDPATDCDPEMQSQACVNCVCSGAWGAWGACRLDGTQVRSRICTPQASCDPEEETRACDICRCSNVWSAWSTCVGGSQSRTRTCEPLVCGASCDDIVETRSCTACGCQCTSWGPWTGCYCNGYKYRERFCYSGNNCQTLQAQCCYWRLGGEGSRDGERCPTGQRQIRNQYSRCTRSRMRQSSSEGKDSC